MICSKCGNEFIISEKTSTTECKNCVKTLHNCYNDLIEAIEDQHYRSQPYNDQLIKLKEQQRHKDAFEKYFTYKQSGKSNEESIKLLIGDIGVTRKSLYAWKKEFDWDGREALRSNEIQKGVEEKTNTTIIENKTRYLSFYHKLLDELEKNPVTIKNVNDLQMVIKGCLLLQDEPTEHTKETNTTDVNLHDKVREREEYYKSLNPTSKSTD